MDPASPPTPCPDRTILERLATGDAPDPALARHADSCPHCRRLLSEIKERDRFLHGFAGLADPPTVDSVPAPTPADPSEESTLSLNPPRAAEPEAPVPRRVGEIELIRELGRGGMGEVWLGHHTLLDRDVAIKFLSAISADPDDPSYSLFLQGARAAAAVRHDGLNVVLHADIADRVPYLVLELIDGPGLNAVLDRRKHLPLPLARSVLAAVCAAVAELHENGIVHRDIKPANIMLASDGRVVVTDFGLSCPRPASVFGAPSGRLAGTPTYMAPEMFGGVVSARTDVYALGITAYELLTGRPPFRGSLDELRRHHTSTPVDPKPLADRGVPEPVRDIILRAAHKDVRFRPRSARHLLEALETAFDRLRLGHADQAALAALASRSAEPAGGAPSSWQATPGGSDYYERLGTLVQARKSSPLHAEAGGALPEPLFARDTLDEGAGPPDEPEPAPPADRAGSARTLLIATLAAAPVQAFLLCAVFPIGRTIWEMLYENLDKGGRLLPMPSRGVTIVGGHEYKGYIPAWIAYLGGGVMLLLVAAIGFALITGVVYNRTLARAARDGPTQCGWCGQRLRRLVTPQCPGCGREIGQEADDLAGSVPPGARVTTWAGIYARAGLAYVSILGLLGAVLSVLWKGGEPGIGWGLFAACAVISAVPMVVCGAVFERFARVMVRLRGTSWCHECGAVLANLREPVCPGCSRAL